MYQYERSPPTRCPIDEYKRYLLYLLDRGQVLIVVGETGSGKSTRIPQILFSAGIYNELLATETNQSNIQTHAGQRYRQICITQPRRVAAMQLAQRVAQDLKCTLGSTVGYAIRFKDVTNVEQTMIKYMTEGLLIREMMSDPLLRKYSVIIVDEVHERNLNTDILLGLLKCILAKRKDLRLITCSATVNVGELLSFFESPNGDDRPNVLQVKGKSYPLKIYYLKQPVANYLDTAVATVRKIHELNRLASGKILIFLTGQDEVEFVCDRLKDYAMTLYNRLDVQQLMVLPFHASLRHEEISKIFDEHGRTTRVCIVATNIAETSLTVDGVGYVIDCGFVKLKIHDCKTGIDCLQRVPISKSSARQRAGRAGRTREGIVYRLYPESQYKQLRDSTMPELQRSPLLETIVLLKSLGVENVTRFPLVSKLPRKNLMAALELLYALQAIDERGNLTATGELMAQFNLDPRISKLLASPQSSGCTSEMCKIAAMLQVKDIYNKPNRHASSLWSSQQLINLCTTEGDITSYLNILNGFLRNEKSQKWADRRCLNYLALLNACEISEKLEAQLKRCRISVTSSTGRTELVQRSVLSGLFPNAATLHPSGDYRTIKGDQVVYIHPTSVLSEMIDRPKYVVFAEIMNTTKPYMRHIMAIEQNWLLEAAPHYYTFSTSLDTRSVQIAR